MTHKTAAQSETKTLFGMCSLAPAHPAPPPASAAPSAACADGSEAHVSPLQPPAELAEGEKDSSPRHAVPAALPSTLHPPCSEPHTRTPPASTSSRRGRASEAADAAAAARLCALLRADDTSVIQCAGRVLRVKHFLPSSAVGRAAIYAVLDALTVNTRVQALYLQNFERGVGDAEIDKLIDVLKLGRIWAVNLGENGDVSKDAWRRLAAALPATAVSFLYVSEHHILRTDIKDKLRAAARANRSRLPPVDPAVARVVKNMWYNPSSHLLSLYKRQHGGALPPREPRPPPRTRPPGWRPPRVRVPRHDPGVRTTSRSAAARAAVAAREAAWERLRVDAADVAAAARRPPPRKGGQELLPPPPTWVAAKRARTGGRASVGSSSSGGWVAAAAELRGGGSDAKPSPPPPPFGGDDLATWDTPLDDLM